MSCRCVAAVLQLCSSCVVVVLQLYYTCVVNGFSFVLVLLWFCCSSVVVVIMLTQQLFKRIQSLFVQKAPAQLSSHQVDTRCVKVCLCIWVCVRVCMCTYCMCLCVLCVHYSSIQLYINICSYERTCLQTCMIICNLKQL